MQSNNPEKRVPITPAELEAIQEQITTIADSLHFQDRAAHQYMYLAARFARLAREQLESPLQIEDDDGVFLRSISTVDTFVNQMSGASELERRFLDEGRNLFAVLSTLVSHDRPMATIAITDNQPHD